NGIRNMIIGNFSPLSLRNDIGILWENFLMAERLKYNAYYKNYAKSYFWRTTQQQEIDYIEEIDGKIIAFEYKWNPKMKAKFSKSFVDTYNPIVHIVNRSNFRTFIMP
ncbi:MAG: DUF4143 domain-containing protein, partial [Bacteroidota bacterium]